MARIKTLITITDVRRRPLFLDRVPVDTLRGWDSGRTPLPRIWLELAVERDGASIHASTEDGDFAGDASYSGEAHARERASYEWGWTPASPWVELASNETAAEAAARLFAAERDRKLIECRNVTVYRGEKKALDGLTLDIRDGEHVAIIGPNGCGKTTFVRTISRDFYPFVGDEDWKLEIMGRRNWHVFELRSMLGIVNNALVAACTCAFPAREIVMSGFFSSVGVWPHHEVLPGMDEVVDRVMDQLEISHLAARPTAELSSGEAHRVVIARALVNGPRALIFDEPSTSLDLRAMHELRSAMRKLAQLGKTIVLVTHHLPDLFPEIERVILMKQGRVFRDGPTRATLTSAHLSELFGLPVEVDERQGFYNVW